ncbi:hypothetical protein [Bacillus sp. LL01]|uniref:hypothetical protein n=1 Tax=Bacillus sp. LL01 TaxID=1665556 RepID=UPI0018E2CCA7|nr:hypothetical protein [Bacillus sp. LL01]
MLEQRHQPITAEIIFLILMIHHQADISEPIESIHVTLSPYALTTEPKLQVDVLPDFRVTVHRLVPVG